MLEQTNQEYADHPTPKPNKRVVLMDDDPTLAKLFQRLVEVYGCSLLWTAHQPVRVEAVAKLAPTLLTLDYLWAGEPLGLWVVQALRGYPPTAGMPILICTGAVERLAAHVDYLQQEHIPVLPKPFLLPQAESILQGLLTDGGSARTGQPPHCGP